MKHHTRTLLTARQRLAIGVIIGLATGTSISMTPAKAIAPLAGWDAAGIFFVASILLSVLRFDSTDAKTHATAENPGRAAADILLLVASIASIVGVILLIFQASTIEEPLKFIYITAALATIIVSWFVIHTTFMLTYAREYYAQPEGGIEFNSKEKPTYYDFAYLAFTVGMTFQVSDTVIASPNVRRIVLRQALLSYIFGTLIIAATINFLAGLGV